MRDQMFQSAPPARGATRSGSRAGGRASGFNPRPPRGGRPPAGGGDEQRQAVSIRAPRAGGDG